MKRLIKIILPISIFAILAILFFLPKADKHPDNYQEMISEVMELAEKEINLNRKDESSPRTLSSKLVKEISNLSRKFVPCEVPIIGMENVENYSPGRGALLIALINSKFDKKTYSEIFRSTTFEGAFLENTNLSGVDLEGIILNRAFLKEIDLEKANLKKANLFKSYIKGGNLTEVNLSNANLRETYLEGANLVSANLNGAYLVYANLNNAKLKGVDLRDANLSGVKLNGSNEGLAFDYE